tara:strand:+ start:3592 stop:4182 length:591 start_codon:yes stop_codon:yes gene_type:complete
MAFDNSIYNVENWVSGKSYSKNDIVARISYAGVASSPNKVPTSIKYYYALSDTDGTLYPESDTANWGGYTTVGKNKFVPLFLWKPSYNISTKHNPRVDVVKFGNGYEQRNQDGLFSGLIQMDITFEKRTEKEARAILHFLKARRGVESFSIKELPNLYGDNTAGGFVKRFVCPSFSSNYIFFNNYTITVSISQENN